MAPDDGACEESLSPEQTHCKLVGSSGLPHDHAAFQKWSLVKAIGHGAFSKVWLSICGPFATSLRIDNRSLYL
jgi:hypothetical protein